jgi:hypothetical protein
VTAFKNLYDGVNLTAANWACVDQVKTWFAKALVSTGEYQVVASVFMANATAPIDPHLDLWYRVTHTDN